MTVEILGLRTTSDGRFRHEILELVTNTLPEAIRAALGVGFIAGQFQVGYAGKTHSLGSREAEFLATYC